MVNPPSTISKALRFAALMTLVLVAGMSTPTLGAPAPPEDTDPAADDGSFAVQPSGPSGPGGRDYFIYTLGAGEVFGDVVAVSNVGTETATFVIYATDAINTSDGSFTLLREEDKPTDVGSWIELGATQYTVNPGERVDIPFSITVPADATPGDHAGAIAAQKVNDPTLPDDGVSLEVRLRVGARIYVRVDGLLSPSIAVENLNVDYDVPVNPFGSSRAIINYVLTNTGNVRLAPTAKLGLSGIFGLGEQQLPDRQIPELLPGSSIEITETVLDVTPYIRLTATLNISAPADGVDVNATVKEWAVSLGLLIGIAALFVILVVGIVWRRRRAAG